MLSTVGSSTRPWKRPKATTRKKTLKKVSATTQVAPSGPKSTTNLEEAPEEVRVGEAEEGEGEVRREAAVEHSGAHVHQSLGKIRNSMSHCYVSTKSIKVTIMFTFKML